VFIYLDESGDLGFKKGASNFFVITFIAMDNQTSLELKRKIKKAVLASNWLTSSLYYPSGSMLFAGLTRSF